MSRKTWFGFWRFAVAEKSRSCQRFVKALQHNSPKTHKKKGGCLKAVGKTTKRLFSVGFPLKPRKGSLSCVSSFQWPLLACRRVLFYVSDSIPKSLGPRPSESLTTSGLQFAKYLASGVPSAVPFSQPETAPGKQKRKRRKNKKTKNKKHHLHPYVFSRRRSNSTPAERLSLAS